MSKNIKMSGDFESNEDYQEKLAEALKTLEQAEEELKGMVINLATAGRWKEWSDNMPEGSVFTFTDDMLHDTGDNNVEELMRLTEEVLKVRKRLAKSVRE